MFEIWNIRIKKEKFQIIQKDFEKVKKKLEKVELKYDEQYHILLELDSVSKKELIFSEIMDDIEEICIYLSKKVVVK